MMYLDPNKLDILEREDTVSLRAQNHFYSDSLTYL